MSFLGEIKRRKVFQVAAVYAVVAWLLVQIVATIEKPLSLPDWVDTIVIVLLAVGFPIAVILAWAFDLTPQGIKSAADVQSGSVPTQTIGQRLSYISQALVLLAVGFLVVDQFILNDVRRSGVDVGSRQSTQQAVVRFTLAHPGTEPIGGANSDAKVAMSPDGRHLAYLVGAGGQAILPLYVRPLDRLEPILLAGSARSPFFSPDGQWIGFVEDNRHLSKVAITGGPSVPLGELRNSVRGASWGSDDSIIYCTNDSSTGLFRIPAGGGEAEILTTPDTANGEVDHLYPEALPEGRGVLFTITNAEGIDNSQIALLDLETGKYRVLIRGGSFANYSESGHIVYGVAGTLRAVPFDLERLAVTGNPVTVLSGVVTGQSGSASFSLARNGTLVYLTGEQDPSRTLVWVDRAGREKPIGVDRQAYFTQRLSPDGQRLALVVGARSEADIWIYDLQRATGSRLTFDPADEFDALWTPDGERVLFSSTRAGGGIYSKAADGTGSIETVLSGEGRLYLEFLSPNADRLVFNRRVDGWDLHILSMQGGDPQPLIEGPGNQERASLSPDGRWIAYASDENGRFEVFVRPFPDVDSGKWQISRSGGDEPQWGSEGRELFYLGPDAMMVIDIETEPTISLGVPRRLFPTAAYAVTDLEWSVSPDGQRFLMQKPVPVITTAGVAEQFSLVVVQNWFEELEGLAPKVK